MDFKPRAAPPPFPSHDFKKKKQRKLLETQRRLSSNLDEAQRKVQHRHDDKVHKRGRDNNPELVEGKVQRLDDKVRQPQRQLDHRQHVDDRNQDDQRDHRGRARVRVLLLRMVVGCLCRGGGHSWVCCVRLSMGVGVVGKKGIGSVGCILSSERGFVPHLARACQTLVSRLTIDGPSPNPLHEEKKWESRSSPVTGGGPGRILAGAAWLSPPLRRNLEAGDCGVTQPPSLPLTLVCVRLVGRLNRAGAEGREGLPFH
ncbi:hypothetical protein DFJ73DRAFT_852120 [Zopfochytrium polystomum]|nr:hypothetical protein DFJ73DRAFT_852120 [Zopfochytrium polystomum]